MENPTGCEKLPRMDMDESCEYTISIHICKLVFLQHPSTKLHICTRELKYNGKIQSITHSLDCGSNFLGASYTFFVVLVIVKMRTLISRRNQDQHLWKCSNYRKHCLGNTASIFHKKRDSCPESHRHASEGSGWTTTRRS